MTTNWPADKVERRKVKALLPYARNARTHSDAQVEQIARSVEEFGWTVPVLVDEDGTIIAGHGRVLAAKKLGLAEVPVMVATGWTDAQRRAYVVADNQLALNAGWDEDLLRGELTAIGNLGFDLGLTGFDDEQLASFMAGGSERRGAADEDDIPEMLPTPATNRGDVWVMGQHRVMCGDSTSGESVGHLTGGIAVDLVCTDPPYCSGGFQESGKSAGSVGTSATHKMIANDTLSTRGFSALLKAAFSSFGAPYLYSFTDWRMWVHLFDVAESSGFGVRSMIVWDKGTPGMGRGWRAQHELVLWGCKRTPDFDKRAPGDGNVISAKRTGNVHHTTEKPVEVVETLLANVPFCKVVADPFNGSGTTLVACEKLGRRYFGMELDPLYVDTTVRRWEAFTGRSATLDGSGATFAEIAAQRAASEAA